MKPFHNTTVRLDPSEIEALSIEVAKLVEDKLLAKASRVLFANLATMVMLLLGGASAYWHLDKRVDIGAESQKATEQRLAIMATEAAGFRQVIETKLESIHYKVDEINRFLRDRSNGADKTKR